jgi:AcrR family transcriptional regulator
VTTEATSEPTRTTRRYDSPVRREQTAKTREAIVAAGARLAHGLGSWDWRPVTAKAVAEAVGISERTVYRHFPTEQSLREAILQRLQDEAGVQIEGLALNELGSHVERLFDYLSTFAASTEPAMDPALADLNDRRTAALLDAVGRQAQGLSERERRQVAGVLDVLWSVATYRRLTGPWGLTPGESTAAVDWLIDAIVSSLAARERLS